MKLEVRMMDPWGGSDEGLEGSMGGGLPGASWALLLDLVAVTQVYSVCEVTEAVHLRYTPFYVYPIFKYNIFMIDNQESAPCILPDRAYCSATFMLLISGPLNSQPPLSLLHKIGIILVSAYRTAKRQPFKFHLHRIYLIQVLRRNIFPFNQLISFI